MSLKNNIKYKKDYSLGKTKENLTLTLIQTEFDSTLIPTTFRYAKCDYVGDECNVELKSRRCSVHSYPDTMISASKINYLLNENKKGYCVFSFFDGIVWTEITPESVATFRKSKGGRCDRGMVETNDYYYIPSSSLKRFVNSPLGVNNQETIDKTTPLAGLFPLLKEQVVSA